MGIASSFYGNMKNNSRSSFIIDKIYPSRAAMEAALKNQDPINPNKIVGDGIFLNRYVMVNYGYTINDDLTDISEIDQDLLYMQVDNAYVNYQNCTNYYIKDSNGKYLKVVEYNANQTYYERKSFVDRFIPKASLYENDEFNEELIGTNDGGPTEHPLYRMHKLADYNKYHAVYDRTVWMKIYIDNTEQYILVASLDAKAPRFEMIPDAPGGDHRAPYFDLYQSSDIYYQYHIPKEWDIVLNEYSPIENAENNYALITKEENETFTEDELLQNLTHYYYERDLKENNENLTFNDNIEYPYYNAAGFDPIWQHNTDDDDSMTSDNYIKFTEVNSGETYPVHIMRHLRLTADTYYPNHYYVPKEKGKQILTLTDDYEYDINTAYYDQRKNYIPLVLNPDGSSTYMPLLKRLENNDMQVPSYYDDITTISDFEKVVENAGFDPNAIYYELTWKFEILEDGSSRRLDAIQKDTKRLDIHLPAIGNAVSDFYDMLYGRPRLIDTNDENGPWNLIGYCRKDEIPTLFSQQVHIPENSDTECWSNAGRTEGNIFYLTDEQIDALSPEIYPGVYDVPIYSYGLRRPYTNEKIMGATIAPYNNVGGTADDISVGWGLDLLKKYLSELRYLASGSTNLDGTGDEMGNGIGLQSDWILDDSDAFGYIHHKPAIIKSFVPTTYKSISDMIRDYNDGNGIDFYIKSVVKIADREHNLKIGDLIFTKITSVEQFDGVDPNNIYELPITLGEESNKDQYTYQPIDANAEFDEDKIYWKQAENGYVKVWKETPKNSKTELTSDAEYIRVNLREEDWDIGYYIYDGSRYVLANEFDDTKKYYRQDFPLSHESDITALVGYNLTVDNNNNITNRELFFHSGSTDNIYLLGSNRVLKDFAVAPDLMNMTSEDKELFNTLLMTIQIPENSEVEPESIEPEEINELSLTRLEICNFLNNNCDLVAIDDENSSFIQEDYILPNIEPAWSNEDISKSFRYARIISSVIRDALDEETFDALQEAGITLYTYELSDSFDPTYYEIHNIWTRALSTAG